MYISVERVNVLFGTCKPYSYEYSSCADQGIFVRVGGWGVGGGVQVSLSKKALTTFFFLFIFLFFFIFSLQLILQKSNRKRGSSVVRHLPIIPYTNPYNL